MASREPRTLRRALRPMRIAVAIGALVTTLGASAYAEPTATEKETARGLMADGRDKREKNDLKGALKAFEAADALMHVPSTGWEVAKTQEQLGLLVEARDTALRVMRIPAAPSDPPPFKDAREKAQALSDSLETRIPAVRIAVKGAADGATTTVTVDGASLPAAALSAPFKVNPGHHVVAAKTETASGQQEIDLKEQETKDVTIVLVAGPVATTTNDADATKPEAPSEAPPPKKTSPLVFVGFGVAGAGIVAGAITGFLSMSAKSSASNGCRDNKCPPSTYADLDTASSMATISTISFVVAGVGAGVGVIGLLMGGKSEEPAPPATTEPATTTTRIRATPWIGLGSAGVRGTF